MATTVKTATRSFSLISSSWTAIQNIGSYDITVYIGGVPTNDDVSGFKLKPGDMAYPDTFGSGDIYIRTNVQGKTSEIAVAE